jgi:hypothetical protein
MLHRKLLLVLSTLVLLALPPSPGLLALPDSQAAAGKETILKASDITPKIFPEMVFYRGRVASVQMRNTGGIHFGDDLYLLAGLVDVTGYSSGVREKYQGYFLTEVPVDINGQALKPGAYGIGFVQGSRFIVTDLGSNNLVEVTSDRDADLKGPVPLQVLAAPDAGSYRLYLGRDYVTLKRAK